MKTITEKLDLFEQWINAIIDNKNSIHVEDQIYLNAVREKLESAIKENCNAPI